MQRFIRPVVQNKIRFGGIRKEVNTMAAKKKAVKKVAKKAVKKVAKKAVKKTVKKAVKKVAKKKKK